MLHIVFLDRATIADGVDIPSPEAPHTWKNHAKTHTDQTLERAKNADLIVTNKVKFDHQTMRQLPKLKHIAIAATGTNCVDLDAAKALSITVSNVPGYATRSASEHVMAMILALRRSLLPYQDDINAGKWQASEQFCFYNQPIFDLSGSTLGLIGTGAIAQQVAVVAKAFGMQVIYHSVSGRKELAGESLVALDKLLTESDIVSLHCPLTPATEHLIDAQKLKLMHTNAVLINTARGSMVDLDALLVALNKQQIAGAGIDVAPAEPPQNDSAIIKLNALPNCIVTPHTAWASRQASQTLINHVVANIDAAANGIALNLVNPD